MSEKKWNGHRWIYFTKKICDYCGKEIECDNSNIKPGKINVCDHNCKRLFKLKQKDFNGWNIINKLDSDEMVYFIGLLCSDGYIFYPHSSKSTRGYVVGIELLHKDYNLLKIIHDKFGGNLRCIKKDKMIKWSISYKEFVLYLINIGITPRKSYTLDVNKWFEKLSNKQKWHFMRGVFDGDGCISYIKTSSSKYTSFICGCSINFLEMIKNFLIQQECHFNFYSKPCKNGKIYSCVFYREYIEKFLDSIYNNKNIYMKRKYELYKDYKRFIKEK